MKLINPLPPKTGDTRTRVEFAWFPARINPTTRVWLEHYEINEYFVSGLWDYDYYEKGYWKEINRKTRCCCASSDSSSP